MGGDSSKVGYPERKVSCMLECPCELVNTHLLVSSMGNKSGPSQSLS